MNRPKITIVTPVFNQAEYLEEAIESVVNQDYEFIEYIIIDDGSKDDSLEVAIRSAKKYEAVDVITQENRGQSAALNRAWAAASGEIISFLSADDRLLPGVVSLMSNTFKQDESLAVAYGDFELIDTEGKPFRQVRVEEFSEQRLTIDLICQPGPGAFFKKEAFQKVGGWNQSLRQVPDFDFWLKVSRLGKFRKVQGPIAEYRVHENSASFRPMSCERADEIIMVVKDYWGEAIGYSDGKKALAKAYILASKNHAQSSRFLKAFNRLIAALIQRPGILLQADIWRAIISGSFRRVLLPVFIIVTKFVMFNSKKT